MRRVAHATLGIALTLLPMAAGANPPQIDYMLHCQGCHLPDGSGAPGAVPPLRDFVGRFLAVDGGRAYLVQVPGSAQSELDDAELAAVLNWILVEFGPAESPGAFVRFSAEEVARYRRNPLADVETVRADLLERMPTP